MALTQISTDGVKNDAISAGKIPANAVGSSEIADDAVDQGAIADEAVDEARLQISNAGTNGQFLQKRSGNTGGLTWATVTVPDSDKIEEGNTSIETVDTGSDGHVKITTEGTEKLRIDSDGQVSIRSSTTAFDGTGDLDALQLHYETDSGKSTVASYSSGGATYLSFATNAGGNAATEKLRIASDGKVGIGCTPSNYLLQIPAGEEIGFHNGSSNYGYFEPYSTAGNMEFNINWGGGSGESIIFKTRDIERFRFDDNGGLGIAGANYGTSGQVLTSGGASAAPSWASPSGGLSEVDQWQYASDVKFIADSGNTLWLGEGTANAWNTGSPRSSGTFTRTPNIGFPVGTGISNTADSSSGSDRYGWFKFPSTGVYRIDMNLQLDRWSFSNKWVTYRTHWSTNGGTSFTTISEGLVRLENTYTKQMVAYACSFVNVTNTSNDIVKFSLETDNTSDPGGGDYSGVVQVKELSNITFMKVN